MKANQQIGVVTLGVMTYFLLAVSGCKTDKAQARQTNQVVQPALVSCADSAEMHPRQVIVLILDLSLSLRRGAQDQLGEILEEASRLVQQLPPATRVVLRYISERSYPDSEHAFTLDIPAVPPAVQCQAFDARCHLAEQQRHALHRCVDEARDRLAAALRELKPKRATKTDVWGAIAAASDVLNAYPRSQKLIVVLSDLIDTVGTPLPNELPGLANTRVLVRLVKNDNPREIAQRLADFSQRLAKWDAKVQELPPDGQFDGDFFAQLPVTGAMLNASK
jgi:hypothetical protein